MLHTVKNTWGSHFIFNRKENTLKEQFVKENFINSLLKQLRFVQVIKGGHNTLLFEHKWCSNLCTTAKFSCFVIKGIFFNGVTAGIAKINPDYMQLNTNNPNTSHPSQTWLILLQVSVLSQRTISLSMFLFKQCFLFFNERGVLK